METLRVKIRVPEGAFRAPLPEERAKRLKAWGALVDVGHEVLGIPFWGPKNGRDADGEAFHPETNTWLNVGDEVPLTYYHGFGPDDPQAWQDPPVVVGKAKLVRVDERGYWFRARYDPDEPLAQRLIEADLAKLRASSGAVGHLVRVRADGLIDVWPVGELAVFDINDWRQPANDYAVVVAVEPEQAEVAAKAQEGAEAAAEPSKGEAARKSETMPAEAGAQTETEGKTVDEKEVKAAEAEQEQPTEPAAALDIGALVEQVKSAAVEAATEAVKALAAEPPTTPPAAVVVGERGEVKGKRVHQINKPDSDYKAKFNRWLRTKALDEGTVGTAMVPVEYGNELVQALNERALFRLAGARVVTQRTLTAKWPKLTNSAAAAIVAEGGTYGEATPTTAEVTATLYKFGRISKVTEELLADSRFNVWGEVLAPDFSNAFTLAENTYFTSGTGTGQPEGILNAPVGVTTASGSAITADEVIDTFYSLNHLYRSRGVWMMHDSTAAAIRKLKDSNGQYLWQTGLRDGTPDMLLGRPVITNNDMPEIALSAKVIAFGDFSYYWIFQHPESTMQRLDELYAENGYIGFKMFRRFDGHIMLDAAFTLLQMAAA